MKKKYLALTATALIATVAFAADKYISSSGDLVLKTAASKKVNMQDSVYVRQDGKLGVGVQTLTSTSKMALSALPTSNTPGTNMHLIHAHTNGTPYWGWRLNTDGNLSLDANPSGFAERLWLDATTGNMCLGNGGGNGAEGSCPASTYGIDKLFGMRNDSDDKQVGIVLSAYTQKHGIYVSGAASPSIPNGLHITDNSGNRVFSINDTGITKARFSDPNGGGDLNYYSESTFSMCVADAVDKIGNIVQARQVRVGKTVTINIPETVITGLDPHTALYIDTNCATLTNPEQLPFLQGTIDMYVPIALIDNGVYQMGYVQIYSSQPNRLYLAGRGSTFTNSASARGIAATSITYSIY